MIIFLLCDLFGVCAEKREICTAISDGYQIKKIEEKKIKKNRKGKNKKIERKKWEKEKKVKVKKHEKKEQKLKWHVILMDFFFVCTVFVPSTKLKSQMKINEAFRTERISMKWGRIDYIQWWAKLVNNFKW